MQSALWDMPNQSLPKHAGWCMSPTQTDLGFVSLSRLPFLVYLLESTKNTKTSRQGEQIALALKPLLEQDA